MPGLFDRLGSTRLTSLKFTDAKDGFGKQIDDEPLVVKSLSDISGYVGTSPNEKDAALENKERVSRFFSTPRGKSFINKQIGLQLSNTKIEGVAGLDALNLQLGPFNLNPNSITSVINIGRDIANNGLSENNALSAISALTRPVSRIGISPLQNYNPQNTLDQIGSDPNTGWNHYDRFGSSNIVSDSDKYWYVVNENNGTDSLFNTGSPGNRLVKLQKSLGTGLEGEGTLRKTADQVTKGLRQVNSFVNKTNSYFNQGLGLANSLGFQGSQLLNDISSEVSKGFSFVKNKLAIADKFIAPFTSNIIDQYEGGPGSLNGIGSTVIKRYDRTNDSVRLDRIKEAARTSLDRKRNLISGDVLSYTAPASISEQYQDETGEDLFKDVGKIGLAAIFGGGAKEITNKVYEIKNYEAIRRTNIPKNQKSVGKVLVDETRKIYTYTYGKQTIGDVKVNKTAENNQYFGKTGKFQQFNRPTPADTSLERVVFTPINPFTGTPFNGGDPKYTGRIYFDAFISNFRDNYTPTWTDINYIGRAETFHIFSKFKRDISFTLQVPCFNPRQLNARHRALSELASTNAGTYSNGKLGGIITYLKLGNYLSPNSGALPLAGEPGIITNFNISIPNDASWDIDQQLAHYLTVEIGFSLIHNSRPEWSRGGWLNNIGPYMDSSWTEDYNPKYDNLILENLTAQKIVPIQTNSLQDLKLPEVKLPSDFSTSTSMEEQPILDNVPFLYTEDL